MTQQNKPRCKKSLGCGEALRRAVGKRVCGQCLACNKHLIKRKGVVIDSLSLSPPDPDSYGGKVFSPPPGDTFGFYDPVHAPFFSKFSPQFIKDYAKHSGCLLLFGDWVMSDLCDSMNGSTPGFPVLHCLPEFAQTDVHWHESSHALLPSSPPVLNLSQHQRLFQQVTSSLYTHSAL